MLMVADGVFLVKHQYYILFFFRYRGSLFLMTELDTLSHFIDLGGVFILSLFMMYMWFKKLGKIDITLTKILTLLSVIVKESTTFNHTNKILGDQKADVKDVLRSAGAE